MTPSPDDTGTSEVSNRQLSRPPFSVRSLAERWDCSEAMIRKLIKAGDLQCFTIGTLIRIPMTEVERIECNGHPSPLDGGKKGSAK